MFSRIMILFSLICVGTAFANPNIAFLQKLMMGSKTQQLIEYNNKWISSHSEAELVFSHVKTLKKYCLRLRNDQINLYLVTEGGTCLGKVEMKVSFGKPFSYQYFETTQEGVVLRGLKLDIGTQQYWLPIDTGFY